MEIKENHFEFALLRRMLWGLTAGRARNHPASRFCKEVQNPGPYRRPAGGPPWAAGGAFACR